MLRAKLPCASRLTLVLSLKRILKHGALEVKNYLSRNWPQRYYQSESHFDVSIRGQVRRLTQIQLTQKPFLLQDKQGHLLEAQRYWLISVMV